MRYLVTAWDNKLIFTFSEKLEVISNNETIKKLGELPDLYMGFCRLKHGC